MASKDDHAQVGDVGKLLAEALKREAEAREEHAAAAEILRLIASSPDDPQPVFDAIARNALKLCDAQGAVVFRYDGELMHVAAHQNINSEAVAGLSREFPVAPDAARNPSGRAILDAAVVHVPDLQSAEEFSDSIPRQTGARSHIAIPLLHRGRAIGAIGISRPTPGAFSDRQLALLQTFADQAVIAIENVRLFKELEARNRDLGETLEQQTATAEILRAISGSPTDLTPILNVVVQSAARFCGSDNASLFQIDGDTLRQDANHGSVGDIAGFRIPIVRGTVGGRTVLERRTVHVADTQAEVEEFPEASILSRSVGHRTILSVPLMRESTPIGVLQLRRAQVRPFTDKQIALLQTFADQAVIAIENVRLFTELQNRNRDLDEALQRQTATSQILGAIASSPTETQPVFDTILENAIRLCDAERGVLFLFDGEAFLEAAMRGVTAAGREFTTGRHIHPGPLTALGRIVTERQPVHIHDVMDDAAYREGDPLRRAVVANEGMRTLLIVPLLAGERLAGAIAIHRVEVRPFDAARIQLLRTFADQAVIAIENVRLFTELQEKNRSLTEALDRQTATSEVLKVISSSPTDVQPVFDAIVRNAVRLCDGLFGSVYRLDGEHIDSVANYNFTPEQESQYRRTWPRVLTDPGDPVTVIRTGEVLQIPNVERHPGFLASAAEVQANLRARGVRSAIGVPMFRQGRVTGAIFVSHSEVDAFADSHVELLKTFADQAVIAIENARLFRELQEKNEALTEAHAKGTEALERQTATSEILRVIGSSPTDVQPVFDTIARSGVTVCRALGCAVFVVDRDMLRVAATHGIRPERVERLREQYPVPLESEIDTAQIIRDRRVVHLADIEHNPIATGEDRDNARLARYRTRLMVPMVRGETAVGLIAVTSEAPTPFSDQQVELLKTFADQAVIAIENVRLFTELQEKNEALTTAHAQVTESLEQQTATSEILGVISRSPTDVQPVFDAIAASAARVCGADDAIIVRVENGALHFVAHFGTVPLSLGAQVLPLTRRIVPGRAILERRTIHVPDLDEARDEYPDAVRAVRTVLVAPLAQESVVVGAIVMRRLEMKPFSDQQVKLLETFADQAVIAIENVRLFTELQASNRELTTALDTQTATSDILRVISRSQTAVQPVFDAIVASAVRLLRGYSGALTRMAGDHLELAALTGTSDVGDTALRARFPQPIHAVSPHPQTIRTRAVVNVFDAQTDPPWPESEREYARIRGYRSVVAVPLLRHDEAIGTISVNRQEPGGFTGDEIALLQTFADQAVIAIENVRLFTELQEKNRAITEALEQQMATSEVLAVISESPTDVQPVFEAILRNGLRLSGADYGGVFRFVDGVFWPMLTTEVRPQLSEHLATFGIPAGPDTPLARVALDLAPVTTADLENDPRFSPPEPHRQEGMRSILSVPMLREGRLVGALTFHTRQVRPFTDKQMELVKTFADQAVIAIENVRLFTELQARTRELTRSVEQLTALGDVGRAVSSTLDLETVLTTIVSRAVDLSGLDGGVVFEFSEENQEFVQRAQAGTGGAIAAARRATRIRAGEGVVGRTAITREPIQVFDITAAGAYVGPNRANLIESGVRAILAVPMVREGQLIGCLGVTRNQPMEFPAETIELLRTFATQSALAIQNARLFHELEIKSRELEIASQHKSEFLANMSHELRTPLNAIIGFSDVLLERMFGEVNEKQTEYLSDILASGKHLLSLINDILDLSKIEAGRMELDLSDFDVPAAIENALTLMRERASRHEITLSRVVENGVGEIRADERKFKQVVLNLLSNAVKFTPAGGKVEVRACLRDGCVEVAVTDTGEGIAPEDQQAVFEEFRQVGKSSRKVEGTGLGLALCRKFVELHGGRISLDSQVGVGSTFTFTVPLRPT